MARARFSVVLGWMLVWVCGVSPAWAGCERPWQRLAPGVWVWPPPQVAEVSVANAGFVAPVTAIIDQGQALVIDPGPSLAHGQRVRAALACQLKARVVAVVNTHAHAENVLGNAAFADVKRIYASAPTAQGMADRCPQCLQSLTDRVGLDPMLGTHIVLPTRVLKTGDFLRVGAQRLKVWAVAQGHTEGDLVLWLPTTRTLWVGGLAYQGRVPELAQGRLDEWLRVLGRLLAVPASAVVSTVVSSASSPGGAAGALAETHAYLAALQQRVWAAMDAGGTPLDAPALALPLAEGWVGYDSRHGFNAQRAWRELEPGWMAR